MNSEKVLMGLVVLVVAMVVGLSLGNSKVSAKEVTRNEAGDSFTKEWEVNVELLEGMEPIFTALGAQIYNERFEYCAYRRFYDKAFNYLLAYAKDSTKFNFIEDNDYYYISEKEMRALSSTAFYGGALDSLSSLNTLEEVKDGYAMYDSANKRYIIRKKEVPMDYSVKVKKFKATEYVHEGRHELYYYVGVELYKAGKYVDDIDFTMEGNEEVNFEDYGVRYGIRNACEKNNRFEVER